MAPNMNPQRNHCLNGDYIKGERLLGQCYSSLLSTFWRLVTGEKSDEPQKGREEEEEIEDINDEEQMSQPSSR